MVISSLNPLHVTINTGSRRGYGSTGLLDENKNGRERLRLVEKHV